MKLCILSHVLGEDANFIYDFETKLQKFGPCPNDAWIVGDITAKRSIETLAKLSNIDFNVKPSNKFFEIKQLLTNEDLIKWRFFLPKKEFNDFLNSIIEKSEVVVKTGCVDYYTNVFNTTQTFINSLDLMKIDSKKLEYYASLEKNQSNKTTLLSFRPDESGFAKKIIYDRTSTITGRMVVTDGPRILTLSKQYKDIITSRYSGGKIMSADYRAIEPRIILGLINKKTPDDLYGFISSEVVNNLLSQTQAKLAIISILYGASPNTISKLLSLEKEKTKFICSKITDFFQISKLENELITELEKNNFILSKFGKHLFIEDQRKIINLYTQSSAVDGVLNGFSKCLDFIRKNNLLIHPIALIHDNILFDIHPDYMMYYDDIVKLCQNIDGFDINFPIRSEEIKCQTL